MTLIQCPSCGNNFEHECRRQAGQGSAMDLDSPVGENEKIILNTLRGLPRACSIREVAHYLYEHKIEHRGRIGWNYHAVQKELSRLVGRGLVEMYPNGNNAWNYQVKKPMIHAAEPIEVKAE